MAYGSDLTKVQNRTGDNANLQKINEQASFRHHRKNAGFCLEQTPGFVHKRAKKNNAYTGFLTQNSSGLFSAKLAFCLISMPKVYDAWTIQQADEAKSFAS